MFVLYVIYVNFISLVPGRYHNMCLKTSECIFTRFDMYQLVTLTPYVRLDQVTTIVYMRLSMTGIIFICSFSPYVEGKSLFVSWIDVKGGVLVGFGFSMLKICSIYTLSSFMEKFPRICWASLSSFTKIFPRSFFFESAIMISMSAMYKIRYIRTC